MPEEKQREAYCMTAAEGAVYLLKNCKPDEPVFILRAQDKLAHLAVLKWCRDAEVAGVNLRKVAGGWNAAKAMLAWPKRRLPD